MATGDVTAVGGWADVSTTEKRAKVGDARRGATFIRRSILESVADFG